MARDKERVLIFDTTLRDGEQSPGASMDREEKLSMARALRDLGADIIEAGFPIASDGDFEAVRAIATEIEGPRIAGLARCNEGDIRRAHEALQHAPRPRLHVFLATSAIHREFKLAMAREEILRRVKFGVSLARELVEDVEFSPEDASRTEPDFLAEVCEVAIAAGATTVNIPDTVGYAMPDEFGATIRHLKENVPNIDQAVISVHCHNDLGFAVANSLAAVSNGARQVECTINGIGERAGNASLEEVVMSLRTRSDFYNIGTNINTEQIYPCSKLLAELTGLSVQRNKAIVGQNAFAHEAGIHQHGVIQHRATYEIMRPQDIGLEQNSLVLGKHSGRHALRLRLKQLGFDLGEAELNKAFTSFKTLADGKKEIVDGDLESLMNADKQDTTAVDSDSWELVDFHLVSGTKSPSTATVSIKDSHGETVTEAACGDGPVEAVFKALNRAGDLELQLVDFQIRGLTSGLNGEGEVSVEIDDQGQHHRARAVGQDIMRASALAFVKIMNRAARSRLQNRETVDVFSS